MLLLRSNDWKLVDVVDGLLKFKSMKFANEYYLAKRAKFVDTESNKVAFMEAELEASFKDWLESKESVALYGQLFK